MLTFDKLCSRMPEFTNEWYETWECGHQQTIEFMKFPLCIDLETMPGEKPKIYLHDYGFGDGPEGITDYYVGCSAAAMFRRLKNAIADVKRRMEMEWN